MSNPFGEVIFRATVAVPGDNEATIIPLGTSVATQRPYKYALDGMQLSAGDDVYVIPISGTYVLLGGAVAGGGDWVTQEELEEALEPHDQVITPYTVGPSSAAAFDASVGGVPLNDLTVNIEPVQAGSGDPSPTNVRPISGWTGCNIHVSPTTTGGTVYPVSWESEAGTVYGGTLDVTTGLLTATWLKSNNLTSVDGATDLGNTLRVSVARFISDDYLALTPTLGHAYCNILPAKAQGYSVDTPGFYIYNTDKKRLYAFFPKSALSTPDVAGINALLAETPLYIVYTLAAPITYQLTPLDVLTLEGRNNVWADCGPVTVTYGDYVKTVYDRIQQGGGSLPAGGAIYDALVKRSAAAGDAIWSPLLYRGDDGGLCEVDEI